jgi:S-adenosylmethionine synthetase
MIFQNEKYTVESVLKGHPDKICDQISDGLLDLYMQYDIHSHTGIECMATGGKIVVSGEISSNASVDVVKACRKIYKDITACEDLDVINLLSKQSRQLSKVVDSGCAGDQGIMYGYACDNDVYNFLPYGYWMVMCLSRRLDLLREATSAFLPDGKIQLTLSGNEIQQLTINVQHKMNADMDAINALIVDKCLYDVESVKTSINLNKGFVRGGIENDTGVTGRKIMIDTYGGLVPHGGGAFSGKDPSKIDRSVAYMCRFVAKNLVANELTRECCVSVAYNFGEEQPSMINVFGDDGTSDKLSKLVCDRFDFRPNAIIERLGLRQIKYFPTATHGHFTDRTYPWERIINL